jgi:hypothetical protein
LCTMPHPDMLQQLQQLWSAYHECYVDPGI